MLAVCKFRGVAFSGVKAVPCAIGAGRPGAARVSVRSIWAKIKRQI